MLDRDELLRIRTAFLEAGRNKSEAARALGLDRTTLRRRLALADIVLGPDDGKPLVGGRVAALKTQRLPRPARGSVRRFIFTCAQNNTRVHEPVWRNLSTLADHYGAEVHVATFTYDKASYGNKSVKRGKGPTTEDRDEPWYDPAIMSCLLDERVEVAPGLVFCGEMNILPTAARPLSGLHNYTGRKSSIVPHVKVALESVPSMRDEATKFMYTTGTVTQRNYVQKKAGLKAEFHHCYGGLLVEVDDRGNWFVRQLNATSDGEIQDLDVRVAPDGTVTTGNRVEAINWGDAHVVLMDPGMERLCWGPGGVAEALRPRYEFLHDVLEVRSRNRHDLRIPIKLFERYARREDSVERDVLETAHFLARRAKAGSRVVVVESNHDRHLEAWLDGSDYRDDPTNAVYFLRLELRRHEAILGGEEDFVLAEWALRNAGCPRSVRFLREDESLVICGDRSEGIQCGLHGDRGPNGSRGTPLGLSRMGRRMNTGHTETAQIVDGVYVAGATASLYRGYNKGPSSWSHSHIVTYPTGKRAIVTVWDNKWRA